MHPCNQCGYIHPPLQSGELCPMAKNSSSLEKFLGELNNEIRDKIDKENISEAKLITFFSKVRELLKEVV